MPDDSSPSWSVRWSVRRVPEHVDHHVGRLIDAIDALGILGDTLIYYIIGETERRPGTLNGAFNELANFNGMAALETQSSCEQDDELGSPIPTTITPSAGRGGWIRRSSGRQVASHWGGTPTRRSCTGPTGSKRRVDCARSSRTSTWHRRSRKLQGCEPTVMSGVAVAYGTSMRTFAEGRTRR